MKNPITYLRLRMRFVADHAEGIERLAQELEAIAADLRSRQPTMSLRRLPIASHDLPSAEVRTIQWIGEMDFQWKEGGPR